MYFFNFRLISNVILPFMLKAHEVGFEEVSPLVINHFLAVLTLSSQKKESPAKARRFRHPIA
jgi:hypothetical protein